MFTTNNVATLQDKNNRCNIEVEINKGGEIKDYVEFRVKDKDKNWVKSYISIKELYSLIFLIVDDKQQQELMPVKQTEVKIIERQHRIMLGKDMKKGEIVVANCRIEVPVRVEENIRALMGKKYQKKSNILIPTKNIM